MNLTYEHLRSTNKDVNDLYDQNETFKRKIQSQLDNPSFNIGMRQVNAYNEYEKAVTEGNSRINDIETSAIRKLSALEEQFNGSSNLTLSEATNLVKELKHSDNYVQAMQNPIMRSAVTVYGGTFGTKSLGDILVAKNDTFKSEYADELSKINPVLDAIDDLCKSFSVTLQQQFGDFHDAETIAQNRYIPEE